jgi:hypothetical protein
LGAKAFDINFDCRLREPAVSGGRTAVAAEAMPRSRVISLARRFSDVQRSEGAGSPLFRFGA